MDIIEIKIDDKIKKECIPLVFEKRSSEYKVVDELPINLQTFCENLMKKVCEILTKRKIYTEFDRINFFRVGIDSSFYIEIGAIIINSNYDVLNLCIVLPEFKIFDSALSNENRFNVIKDIELKLL